MSSEPAFPVSTSDGEQGHQDGDDTWQFPGMSLRDYFAAKALPLAWDYTRRIDCGDKGSGADPTECRFDLNVDPDEGIDDCPHIASIAYRMADAMIKVRDAE